MKNRLLLFFAFIMTVIVMNAQTGCNVFITSSFDSKCVLDDEKGNILIEKGEAMLACKESQVIYTATSSDATSYTWTIIGAYSYSANGNTVTVNWNNGNTGKVTVQIATSDGSICEATKDIFLIEKPQIGSSSIPNYVWENGVKVIYICLGETVTFTNESATSNTDLIGHYWESIYGTASTENYTIENVMQGTKVIHRIINNCGCEDEENYEIRILGGEKLELSCYGTVCENTTVTYEALNASCSDYNWFVEGGQIISGQHSPKITIQWGSPQCGYGVLGLDGGLCENFCPKLMSVKIPIITNNAEIKGQITACVGEVALYELTLWGSTEYTWTITPSIGVSQSHYDNANQTLLTFNSPGTYQLSATYKCDFLECGPFTSQTKTITVKPELKISSENEKICLGQAATFTLNNTTISARWRVYNANNQQVYTTLTNSLTYTPTSSGKYRVTAEHADYCNVAEFLINVKDPPPAPTGANLSGKHYVCPNSSILLTGTPSSPFYSLVWKSLCSTPAIEGTGNEFTVNYPGNGCNVEVYHYDKEIGCLSTTPYIYQIQDFNLAATTLPTSGITVCAESTIEYINNEVPNQSPDVLYEWKISPEYAATVIGDKTQNNVRILVNTSTQTTFNIILERKYCTNIISTITIPVTIVTPPPAPTITPSPLPNSCVNNYITLTGNGTITNNNSDFNWSIDNGSATYNSSRIINHRFTTTGTHNIELLYQPYTVCPASTVSTTINIVDLPNFSLHDNGSGQITVTPHDGGNYTSYYWTINGTPSSETTNTLSGASINDVICCTVTNTTGCSRQRCITLYQAPGNNYPPCVHMNASIIEDNICTNQSVKVEATNPTGNQVTWSITPDISYGSITQTSIDDAVITFNIPGNYTATGYVSDGTNCYTSTTLNITVPCILDFDLEYSCSPTIGIKITDNSQYLGGSPNRTFNITGGITPVTMLSNELVKTQYVALPTSGSVTYNVTLTVNGCTLTKSITLYPRITSASITAPYSNKACQDVPLLLTANPLPLSTPIKTYDWNFDDGSSNNSSTTNTIYHIFQVRPTAYQVGVNITDVNNCIYTMPIGSKISITSKTKDLLSTYLYSPIAPVCPGLQKQITYRSTPTLLGNTYAWTPPASPNNNINPYSAYQTGDYFVKVISNIGCIDQAMINVPFKNKPNAFISGKTEYCQNDKVELFGDIGSSSSSVAYTWDITTPTTTLPQQTTPNITFTASQIGTYTVVLTVDNGDCSDTYTHTFTVNATPVAPSISFVGNQCIDQPPVVLGATAPNGESIYWSSGIHNPTADYYSPGYALAYYYEQISGCKSQEANILIPSAPNFDALLTGCYKKCKYLLPPSINVYNLTKDNIYWKWLLDQNLLTSGSGNYLFSPLTLPLSGFGTYNLDVQYNNYNCHVISPSLVIEEEDCPCSKLDLKVTPHQDINNCRIIYHVDVTICNNGSNTACFDDLSSLISGINILGTNNFPLTVASGDCETFNFKFEVTDPLVSFAEFQLYDKCNKCYKDFTVDIKVEVIKCEDELKINKLDFRSDLSNHYVSYFDFELFLPSNPQAVFRVWTDPSQVIDYVYNSSSSTINGLTMFDYGVLTQMAENGEKVCLHVIMCKGDIFCESEICIGAQELLDIIKAGGGKSTPSKENTKEDQEGTLYLVPNPADTYVKVEGIEQDNISELLLIDMTGKNLKKVQATNTLDIKDVLKGTYILRVINKENKVYYLKLIKN